MGYMGSWGTWGTCVHGLHGVVRCMGPGGDWGTWGAWGQGVHGVVAPMRCTGSPGQGGCMGSNLCPQRTWARFVALMISVSSYVTTAEHNENDSMAFCSCLRCVSVQGVKKNIPQQVTSHQRSSTFMCGCKPEADANICPTMCVKTTCLYQVHNADSWGAPLFHSVLVRAGWPGGCRQADP